MGLGRQEGEDRVTQEKNPSVQKSGASCSVGTFKQPKHSFSVKPPFPHMYSKFVL